MQAPARKQPGRKPLPAGAGKTARVELRVQPDKKTAWQAKADAAGMSLNAWAEARLDKPVGSPVDCHVRPAVAEVRK